MTDQQRLVVLTHVVLIAAYLVAGSLAAVLAIAVLAKPERYLDLFLGVFAVGGIR